ncbi:hypothetical protein BBK36DRAFT_1120744 [Trichoderma citrinoviride]|uniref:Uncharacterized protein n=1 Tax=Trichoderma citrinoviride TaxID=58853 RepID=A0A2T4B951_9HYPO|nr:hypothetical protein BBK36DRAFT_1120744 [Trichoderma citrinoviride]PTB65840.1 hypothetical protein BBK36DRAFT_1120744 [Trichoderma citrinoviride]
MDPTGVGGAILGGSDSVSAVTEEEAQRRVDVAVSSNSKKWIDVHQAFQDLLANGGMTLRQILPAFFTSHETRLFMLSEAVILKGIQEDNTYRYHRLLQTRFQGVTSDIPTKLTMLYFGLPIEPERLSLTESTFDMEVQEPKPSRDAVEPPLHFLSAHKERNWDEDTLSGKLINSPIPAIPFRHFLRRPSDLREGQLGDGQPVVHLRGGGRDDDSDWAEDSFSGLSSGESDGDDDEDGSDADDTMEDQPDRMEVDPNTESEDGNSQETDSVEDISSVEIASRNWISLYGFQGRVPFIPGDRQTYEDAIRKLLSLGPQERTNFSIVHFDNQTITINTIHDTVPLKASSTTLHFITEKVSKGGDTPPNNRHTFFIKLQKESIPEHWQPSEKHLNTIVSCVLYTPEGEEAHMRGAPASCCYLNFPGSHGSRPSQEVVCGWGADQCNEYLRTAFEVLLGQPKGHFHHAFFRLGQCDSDFATAPPIYGFSAISSSDILSLIPAGDGTLSSLRCNKLGDKETAFVLPGFHFTTSLPLDESDKDTVTGLLSFIRQMITSAFGDSVKHLKYVRLLDGRATLGPNINRDQDYYSIRMSDDLPQNCKISYASALSKIVAAGNPFVLLYPEWEEDQCFFSTTGGDGAEHHVRMPPLSSTLDDLWRSVSDLMSRAGLDHKRPEELRAGDALISIQPKFNHEPASAEVDAPCFFIGPEATDEQWFSIRARITTSVASIKVHDSETFDWRAQVDKSCIWGPRYGSVAGVKPAAHNTEKGAAKEQGRYKAIQKATDDAAQENGKYLAENAVREAGFPPAASGASEASLGEGEPTGQPHSDTTTIPHRLGAASSSSKRRRRAWAAQPSIFDKYGRFPRLANSGIQLPAYAPPVEHMLRTDPRMPMISKAILTPTEQGELQRITWDLRGLCLNRTMRCPYEGCRFAYRIDNQQAVVKHLEASHTGRKCMWCNDVLPGHWSAGKVQRHMREKHKDMLMEALGVNKATIRQFDGQGTISVPLRKVKRYEKPPPTDPASGGSASSLLQKGDAAAFRQQQRNHQLQVAEADFDAIVSDGEEHDLDGMNLDDAHEQPKQAKPTESLREGGRVQATTGQLEDEFSMTLRAAMEAAGVGLKVPRIANPDSNARRYDQNTLQDVLPRRMSKSPSNGHAASAYNASDTSSPHRPSSQPSSPDPLAEEGEKEKGNPQVQEKATLFELEDDSSESDSSPDDGSEFGEENGQVERESDEESDGDLQGTASSAKRRKPRGRQRGRQGDRDYKYEADEEDDEDSESDVDGQKARPPRRDPSPNWHRVLGPDDPEFEPTDEYYCSKCFRKAPKKHNRDRSPLGRAKEIELHYDSTRCCGIRRGIGSIKRLPNRSGWIPASIMPKPLSNLRKQFLRRYPSYARTLYPLNITNANGSYWRSDPNNDENKDWWSIPWPPYRGPSPLPNGWVAPDVADAPIAGKARSQFQLKPVADPTYREGKGDAMESDDDEEIESDKDTNGKRKRKSRPSSAFASKETVPTPAKKAQKPTPKKAEKMNAQRPLRRKKTPMLQKVLKAKAASPKKVMNKKKEAEKTAPVRRSMRKRQKTK